MPIEITYNPEKDRFERNLSGNVEARDIGETESALYAHPNWEGGKPRLIRVAPSTDLSATTLEAIQAEVLGPRHDLLAKSGLGRERKGAKIDHQALWPDPGNARALGNRNFRERSGGGGLAR